MPNSSRTNATLHSANDWWARVVSSIQGKGVLLKMLGNADPLDELFAEVTWDWDAEINDGYTRGLVNDCASNDMTIKDCSAWAFVRQNFVPMVYNWPESYHQVGIMVDLSVPEVWNLVTRMHVVDGDTAERYKSGIAVDDLHNWEDALAGDEECLKLLQDGADYRCYLGEGESWCGKDLNPQQLIAPVGNGQDWAKWFMLDAEGGANHFNLNIRQCPFAGGSEESWEAFQTALESFYASASKAVWPQDVSKLGDDKLYLETEVNMETPANELMDTLKNTDAILAVVVQTNLCKDQLGGLGDKVCPSEEEDIANIKKAIHTACSLASGALPGVSVIAASFPSNAFPDTTPDGDESCWNWYRGKIRNADTYLPAATPEQYLEPIDCNADYDERYSQLSRKGCTDDA